MRAVAVHPSARSIDVVEVGEPGRPAGDGVLARVLEVGICGTDREIAAFEYGTPPEGEERLVIGHEALAEVVDAGEAVAGIRPGDLVVPMVRRPCGRPGCRPCAKGRQDYCATGEYRERGITGCHGYMTELIGDAECYMVPVASELRDVAVLTEPLTIAEKALEQVLAIQRRLPWSPEGSTAVVIGAGPVGLLGAMALRIRGFRTAVYSRSRPPHPKAALAEAIGAEYVSSQDVAPRDLPGLLGPVDVVYEAAGVARLAFDALSVLGPNGVLVLTGVPAPEPPQEEDVAAMMRRLVLGNQVVAGTVNAGRSSYETAASSLLEFHRRWPGALRALITGRHRLEEAPGLLTRHGGGIKEVVAVGREG
jgi:threonine dehydrogenase-like Zn-dependent dehydrogenase